MPVPAAKTEEILPGGRILTPGACSEAKRKTACLEKFLQTVLDILFRNIQRNPYVYFEINTLTAAFSMHMIV